jgi:L-cystine uptake protein TcyP (sodium:dicarboxylate symporter family)
MDVLKMFIAGVVGVAMITAFGLHASGLAQVTSSAGKAGQGLIGTAETGK